jgi:peptidyl-tRNA hydrolase ICT1
MSSYILAILSGCTRIVPFFLTPTAFDTSLLLAINEYRLRAAVLAAAALVSRDQRGHKKASNENERERLLEYIKTFRVSLVPKQHLAATYSRSSGPGGQHVNKTNSKARVALSLNYFPADIRRVLEQHEDVKSKLVSGALVTACDSFRSSFQNYDQ